MMNILTGQDWEGNPVTKDSVPPPLQPFHGMLAYNTYDDSDNAKWHHVADAFVPFICGALGAMAGSSAFSRGLKISDEISIAASPLTTSLKKDLTAGKFYLQHADMLGNREHARLFNILSSSGLNWGSTTGLHLFPSMFSASTNAFRFQLDQGKNIVTIWLRDLTHNRGHSSRNMFTALPDFIKWTENAAAHYKGSKWVDEAAEKLIDESGVISKYAKDMLQLFKHVTPEQQKLLEDRISAVCRELDTIAIKTAQEQNIGGEKLVAALSAEGSAFRQIANNFATDGLEKAFVDAKLLDPTNKTATFDNLALADHGTISSMLKPFGITRKVDRHREAWWKAFEQRQHGEKAGDLSALLPDDRPSYLKGTAAISGIIGTAALLGGFGKAHPEQSEASPILSAEERAQLPRHEAARRVLAAEEKLEDNSGVSGFINGKPLDALDWLSRVTVVPPGTHRFMNAAFLTTFLVVGARLSCALAGRGLRGEYIGPDKIWPVFKPLYGKMSYNPVSLNTADRWKKVAHQLIPVTVGAIGTYTGSRTYFGERINETRKAEYLEDYTDKVAMDESESYARASAVTSVLNTGSGFHMLPLMGYPSHLQNRFLMAKGQQVATPYLGAWWSGNPSTYPWHVKTLLKRMVSYAVENPDEYPRQFDKMAHAFVAKLYPGMPPETVNEKRDALVDKLYAVRDKYWLPGGIPQDKQLECKQELNEHFRKAGLERTLQEIGLDPLQAALDNNGAGGRLAHIMGATGRVERDLSEYREKAQKRLNTPANDNRTTPDTRIPNPAETLAIHSSLQPALRTAR